MRAHRTHYVIVAQSTEFKDRKHRSHAPLLPSTRVVENLGSHGTCQEALHRHHKGMAPTSATTLSREDLSRHLSRDILLLDSFHHHRDRPRPAAALLHHVLAWCNCRCRVWLDLPRLSGGHYSIMVLTRFFNRYDSIQHPSSLPNGCNNH